LNGHGFNNETRRFFGFKLRLRGTAAIVCSLIWFIQECAGGGSFFAVPARFLLSANPVGKHCFLRVLVKLPFGEGGFK